MSGKVNLKLRVTDGGPMTIKNWQKRIHGCAVSKGFWKEGEKRNRGEIIALIHSELSEALEALRHGNPADEHVPQHSSLAVELADAVIRIFDFAEAEGIDLEVVMEDKHAFNEGRPYKHGKRF